jgi:lipid-A-disaccharide synthase
MKTLWINAGEISGDLQGGSLLAALREFAHEDQLRVVGMGGDSLARAGQENLLRV